MLTKHYQTMKKIVVLLFFGISTPIVAQQTERNISYQQKGDVVYFIEYHANGILAQTGQIRDHLNDGLWSAYNDEGQKIAEGQYEKGRRVSKWFFWDEDSLVEVDFEDNKIIKAIRWDQSQIIADAQSF